MKSSQPNSSTFVSQVRTSLLRNRVKSGISALVITCGSLGLVATNNDVREILNLRPIPVSGK